MTNDDAPTARMAGRFLTGWRRALGHLERLQAQLVAMESVSRPEAGRSLLATFVVESGKPGPVRA